MSSYKKALSFLSRIEKRRGIKLGLGRVKRALKLFGNPHLEMRTVHVAGTNGKGSVCAFVSQILKEAGYKVGLYTSPYIYEPTEKIRINGKKISKEKYAKLILDIKKITEKKKIKLTFFEYNTVAAFIYFAQRKVDFAVLETGMGGRLDATNVCRARVAVITNVELEHAKYLGKTKMKIAGEKAAIIKCGQTVITAEKNKKILGLFRKLCRKKNAKLVAVRKDVDYKLGLKGEFQKINATCAVEAAKALHIKKKFVVGGLKKTKWPARFQIIRKKPLLLVDAAHNPSGMKALVDSLEKEFPKRKFVFVLGFSEGKDYKKMLKILAPLAKKIYAGRSKYHGMKVGKIIKEAEKHCYAGKFRNLRHLKNEDVVVCGSIYFLSSALKPISLR